MDNEVTGGVNMNIELTEKKAKELLYAIAHERCDLRSGLSYATEIVKSKVVDAIKTLSNVEKKIKK